MESGEAMGGTPGREAVSPPAAVDDQAERETKQFVTVSVGDEIFGVEIDRVQEIISYHGFNVLPGQPDDMPGVFSLRGVVIPALDLRLRFGFEAREYDKYTVIMVVKSAGQRYGLVVDGVTDVVDLALDELQDSPELTGQGKKDYIQALGRKGDQLIIILDMDKLLDRETMDGLRAGADVSAGD